jgi:adenylate kinase
MNIVLLGPPGAGKGTQAERIAARLGLRKLATGDVLRAAVRDGTPQGMRAKSHMDRGDLVPDSVILGIMRDALSEPASAPGVVLDGVVRTVPQAEGLRQVMAELGRRLDAVVLFEIDDETLVKRLSGRTVCERCQTPFSSRAPGSVCDKCGGTLVRRRDDEPDAIRNRMKVYREQTQPVVEWYQRGGGESAGADGRHRSADSSTTRIIPIDAAGTVDEVTDRVLRELRV